MRHQVRGRKLKRTSSHRKALLRNLATALFEHKKIETTEAKAKELRPFAEKLISKAKNAYKREQNGLLPEGQTVDIHNRRIVGRIVRSKAVLQELFDTIAPAVETRNGGYCRIVKTGIRRGDGGKSAIIELVDWSSPKDGIVSANEAKKKAVERRSRVEKSKAGKKAASVTEKEVREEEIVETESESAEIDTDLSTEQSDSEENNIQEEAAMTVVTVPPLEEIEGEEPVEMKSTAAESEDIPTAEESAPVIEDVIKPDGSTEDSTDDKKE